MRCHQEVHSKEPNRLSSLSWRSIEIHSSYVVASEPFSVRESADCSTIVLSFDATLPARSAGAISTRSVTFNGQCLIKEPLDRMDVLKRRYLEPALLSNGLHIEAKLSQCGNVEDIAPIRDQHGFFIHLATQPSQCELH